MLLKPDATPIGACILDQFDSPFVHDAFVRAGEGRVSSGPLQVVHEGGYRLVYEVRRSPFSLGAQFAAYWAHGYGPIGAGFLDPSTQSIRDKDSFHLALDGLVREANPAFVFWPYFPVESREYEWLKSWLVDRRGVGADGSILSLRDHERAVIDCRDEESSLGNCGFSLRKKKNKELNRQHRRLEELGDLRYVSTLDGLDRDVAIEAFLKTEASGWKALKGTALAVDGNLRAFVADFLPQMLDEGCAQIDLMMLGEDCIAGLISFRAGRGLFTWKTGMDEVYKRYSPGVHMMLSVSRAAVANPDIDYIDSLADPDHPMADHIWAGRRRYAHLFVPLSGFGRLASHTLRAGYIGKDKARYWAKRALGRV